MKSKLPPYENIKHLVESLCFENGNWISSYAPLEIVMVGYTEESSVEGVRVAYESHVKGQILFPNSIKFVEFPTMKHLVQTKYLEGGDIWVACYIPKGISVIAKTKEIVLRGIEEAYETHRPRN